MDQSLLLYRYHPSAATHAVLEYVGPGRAGREVLWAWRGRPGPRARCELTRGGVHVQEATSGGWGVRCRPSGGPRAAPHPALGVLGRPAHPPPFPSLPGARATAPAGREAAAGTRWVEEEEGVPMPLVRAVRCVCVCRDVRPSPPASLCSPWGQREWALRSVVCPLTLRSWRPASSGGSVTGRRSWLLDRTPCLGRGCCPHTEGPGALSPQRGSHETGAPGLPAVCPPKALWKESAWCCPAAHRPLVGLVAPVEGGPGNRPEGPSLPACMHLASLASGLFR